MGLTSKKAAAMAWEKTKRGDEIARLVANGAIANEVHDVGNSLVFLMPCLNL